MFTLSIYSNTFIKVPASNTANPGKEVTIINFIKSLVKEEKISKVDRILEGQIEKSQKEITLEENMGSPPRTGLTILLTSRVS